MFLVEPTNRAVIVGSAQPVDEALEARCRRAGYSLVRRHSGGGGVVVEPGTLVWVDVFLPSDDPLFRRDVRTGSFWLGELWAQIGRELLPTGSVRVHQGGLITNEWSTVSCFLGTGPGEVLVEDKKMVGLSQRRTRAGAWFFSLVYRAMRPVADAALLSGDDSGALARALSTQVFELKVSADEVEKTLLRALADFERC